MALLFATNEPHGMKLTSSSVITMDAGASTQIGNMIDTDYARDEDGAMYIAATINDAEQAYVDVSGSDIWLQARYEDNNGSGAGNDTDRILMGLYDTANAVYVVRVNCASSSTFQFEYWNGSSYTTIGAAWIKTGLAQDAERVTIRAKIDASSGAFQVYRNGTLHAEITGNTDFYSGSTDRAVLNVFCTSSVITGFTDIIVADESCLTWRVATLVPDGDGTNTAGTGAYTDIDDAAFNDSDLVSLSTAATVRTHTLPSLNATPAGFAIKGVVVTSRTRRGSTGPQNFQHAVVVGGTTYTGATIAPNLGFDQYYTVWTTSPDTATTWTNAEINGLESGLKAIT